MRKILAAGLFYFSALLLSAMVASLFIQVLAREFKWNVDWSEELARFAFISAVFLASSYATLTKSHLRVSFFSDVVAKRIGHKPVSNFQLIVRLGFDVCVIYYASINLIDGFRYPNISPSLGFNQNILFSLMVLGFTLSALILLHDLFVGEPPGPKAEGGIVTGE